MFSYWDLSQTGLKEADPKVRQLLHTHCLSHTDFSRLYAIHNHKEKTQNWREMQTEPQLISDTRSLTSLHKIEAQRKVHSVSLLTGWPAERTKVQPRPPVRRSRVPSLHWSILFQKEKERCHDLQGLLPTKACNIWERAGHWSLPGQMGLVNKLFPEGTQKSQFKK